MSDKQRAIEHAKASGWVRHNGTEWGDDGRSPYGRQHKSGFGKPLAKVRELNKWLRTQDDLWVSPSGRITHWSEIPTPQSHV